MTAADKARKMLEPVNPWPENAPSGRAWNKGRDDWLSWAAASMCRQADIHAAQLEALQGRVRELEAEPTEAEVEAVAKAVGDVLIRIWAGHDPMRPDGREYTSAAAYQSAIAAFDQSHGRGEIRAALTAFLTQRKQIASPEKEG